MSGEGVGGAPESSEDCTPVAPVCGFPRSNRTGRPRVRSYSSSAQEPGSGSCDTGHWQWREGGGGDWQWREAVGGHWQWRETGQAQDDWKGSGQEAYWKARDWVVSGQAQDWAGTWSGETGEAWHDSPQETGYWQWHEIAQRPKPSVAPLFEKEEEKEEQGYQEEEEHQEEEEEQENH